MSDDRSGDRTTDGLIDVTALTIDELSVVTEADLGRALDHILNTSQNSVGFHGFNNHI
jgi:hypothetical protein